MVDAVHAGRTLDVVAGRAADPNAPLLEVEGLTVEFRMRSGTLHAVNGLSYTLEEGETIAILGESGCGKSVSARAVMGILESPPAHVTSGSVRLRGVDVLALPPADRRSLRGERIAMVFQDALAALNPVYPVGWQISEMFRVHRGLGRRRARERAWELMDRVRIPSARERMDAYPHEFSGGMRQRVMIAMALALDPDVLIADEPTTALDVTVQAQILTLLADLQRDTGMGMVLITHDLGVVAEAADRVSVVYAGEVVEAGPIEEVHVRPAHPYTVGLLQSVPRADMRDQPLRPIAGQPPDMAAIPSGCAFHPRCPWVRDRCHEEHPVQYRVAGTERRSACHFHEEVLHGEH